MYNLYLDDFRSPIDSFYYLGNPIYNILDWKIVRNYNEFVKMIQENGIPETISFDNDLADIHYENQSNINYDDCIEKTGYHCAKWLIDYCLDNKSMIPKTITILVHSMNPVGSKNIKSLFISYNKHIDFIFMF